MKTNDEREENVEGKKGKKTEKQRLKTDMSVLSRMDDW